MAKRTDKTAEAPARALPSRLERLRALRDGRVLGKVTSLAGPAETSTPRRPVKAEPGAEKSKTGRNSLEKMSMANPIVKKMLHAMTRMSKDGKDSIIEGTPFTRSGVTRLMKALAEKSARPEEKGAKMAGAMQDYLKPVDGEAEVGGASIDKLKAFARMAAPQMRKRR